MAIGPQQFAKNFEDEATKFETRIDTALKAKGRYNNARREVWIALEGYPDPEVQEILIQRYTNKSVGWKSVRFESDQRDGNHIVLTAPGELSERG